MNRRTVGLVAGGLLIGALLLGSAGAFFAGASPAVPGFGWMMDASGSGSMMNGSERSNMMGGSGPRGMMNGSGSHGMMAGYGTGGMMGSWNQASPSGKVLTLDQARQSVQGYIDQLGNKNLAIDEVMEFQRNFYAIVKDTSTNHGAFEVLVNKVTGAVSLEPGPAMMWNTKYGMMNRMMGYQQPSGPMTVSAAKAEQISQQWLAQYQPGATTESPDQFPGYYTIHFRAHGQVAGMLSVNGYTGQVWYHSWHGAFIR